MFTPHETDVLTFFNCGATVSEIAEALHVDRLQVSMTLFMVYRELAYGKREKLLRPLYRVGYPFPQVECRDLKH